MKEKFICYFWNISPKKAWKNKPRRCFVSRYKHQCQERCDKHKDYHLARVVNTKPVEYYYFTDRWVDKEINNFIYNLATRGVQIQEGGTCDDTRGVEGGTKGVSTKT